MRAMMLTLRCQVKDATADQYFKVVSEALRVCSAMVVAAGASRVEFVVKVYAAVRPQMLALDIDQAVKGELFVVLFSLVNVAHWQRLPSAPPHWWWRRCPTRHRI